MFGSLMMLASGVSTSRAQLGQVVRDLPPIVQRIREDREDSARERDVTGLHRHSGRPRERSDDGEKRMGRQGGGFVGPGIDDRG